jgi:hypothetical protein
MSAPFFFPALPHELPLSFLLIPLLALLALLAQLVATLTDLVLGPVSAAWPRVTGTIEGAEVVRRGTRNRYRPAIVYTYAVAGRTYRRRRRIFGAEGTALRGSAEAIAARYRVGETVAVAHHPTRHGFAVLEPGMALASILFRLGEAGLGLVILVPILRFILPSVQSHLGLGG